MRLDSDVVLIGSGIQPLVAAQEFIRQGKEVLILNPLRHFFSEKLEFPHSYFSDLAHADVETKIFAPILSCYPGSMEWRDLTKSASDLGVKSINSPYLRTREHVRLQMARKSESEAAGLFGVRLAHRVPGVGHVKSDAEYIEFTGRVEGKTSDFDLDPYLESVENFVTERLTGERVLSQVSEIKLHATGLSFRSPKQQGSIKVKEKVILFFSPKILDALAGLMQTHFPKWNRDFYFETFEEFWVKSRDALASERSASLGEIFSYPIEAGDPRGNSRRLGVWIRATPIPVRDEAFSRQAMKFDWLGEKTLVHLKDFVRTVLKWDFFDLDRFQAHTGFYTDKPIRSFKKKLESFSFTAIPKTHGFLSDLIATAKGVAQEEN